MPIIALIIIFFAMPVQAEDLPPLATKAEKLYEMGDYDNSMDLFYDCYADSRNSDCVSLPIVLLEKTYSALPKITRHSLTRFKPAKTNISVMEYIKREASEWLNPGKIISNIFSFSIGGPLVAGVPSPDSYVRLYEFVTGSNSPGAPIQIANPETVKSVTSLIPLFKTWTHKLSALSRNCYARDDQEVCLGYMDKIKQLRINLDSYYSEFFSYEVASPILAKTAQLIFIADTSKTFGVDENMLRNAAALLGTLNDDIFLHVNQDVRNQFLEVYRELKDKAGKELIEEMKVIQTMQDKFLNSRYAEPMF